MSWLERIGRFLMAYGVFTVFCFVLFSVTKTVDGWTYWGPVLLTILYGAALAFATVEWD